MSADGPTMFGRYVVIEQVGAGSTGTVYRARHTELDRIAALKVLRDEVRLSPDAVTTLRNEARVLAELDHPHIVGLYEFVEEPTRTWLAEQWVDGAPLDAILDRHRRLTPEQALGVLAGALAGLAHAHEHGVVHRDIAASNIIADTAGTSMLVDFGLAAPQDVAGAGVSGTPAYLSPEAARGEPVGKAGDVYSAAALTYHLLSGLPVFTGTPWEMVAAHRDAPAPLLQGHGPRMQALVERSLDKDPAARPPDAGAFLAELEVAARERYGAGWRSEASIAALVASTMAGTTAGVVAAAGGAGAGLAGPAGPVSPAVSDVVTGVTQTAVSTGTSTGVKAAIAAGVTGTVVIAGIVAFVLVSNADENDGAPGGSSQSEPTLSEEELAEQREQEQIEELTASSPSGVYTVTIEWTKAVKRGGGVDKLDDVVTEKWDFGGADCTAERCKGTADKKKDDGDGFGFTWDGTDFMLSSPKLNGEKQACFDTVTGEKSPISEAAATIDIVYSYDTASVTPADDGGPPTEIVIDHFQKLSYEFFGTCEESPDDVVRYEGVFTLERKG